MTMATTEKTPRTRKPRKAKAEAVEAPVRIEPTSQEKPVQSGQRGRPREYGADTRAYLCQQMALGRTLNAICKEPDMPSKGTVMDWKLRDVDGFSAQYGAARDLMLEHWAEETVDLADDCKAEPAEVAKARLRVDSRKWILAKLKPGTYGDKVALTDADGGTLKVKMVA